MDTHPRRALRSGDIVHDEHGNPLRLDEELGSGGQGTVWSVENTRVAVKVLRGRQQDAAALQGRLRAVSRLDLSGIPIARPYAMLRDHAGYVMELLADMTGFGTFVRPPQSVPAWYRETGGLRRRLRLLATTAQALSRLHGRAIAYGDVSPSNVLVSNDSRHDQVWLIDPDNLTLVTSASGLAVGTPGYQAPELTAGTAAVSTLTDVFAFAVLAFHVLVLAHPFKGDLVRKDPDRELDAFEGRLPWIDDPADDRNRATGNSRLREIVLTPGLLRLFRRAFEEGLRDPVTRPSMAEWCEKLDQAALATITCPGCAGTYYVTDSACPWCSAAKPRVAKCDIHASVPPLGDPDFPDRLETRRLVSVVLTPEEPAVVRARNGLVCLDAGPGHQASSPDEPLAELVWDGAAQVRVRRAGRHSVWLADPEGERGRQLRAGEWLDLPRSRSGRWTVRFGPPEQVHRFVRFREQGTAE